MIVVPLHVVVPKAAASELKILLPSSCFGSFLGLRRKKSFLNPRCCRRGGGAEQMTSVKLSCVGMGELKGRHKKGLAEALILSLLRR